MNINVSEELVNNDGLLNWTIDRTNNVSPDSIPSYELLEQQPSVIEREYEGEGAYVLSIPDTHFIQPMYVVGLDQVRINNYYLNLFRFCDITFNKFDISIVIEDAKEEQEQEQDFDCPICFELTKTESKITLNCGHTFCGQCIKKTLTSCNGRTPTCALCRTSVTSLKVPNKEMHDLVAPHCNNVV
jgi:hypothetical protein